MEYEPITTSEPINEDPSPSPELRALYDGDISSTILEKLSAYYLQHSDKLDPEDYFIVRTDQNDYSLYYGNISSQGSIDYATRVRYYGVTVSGYYGTAYRLSVSELGSGSVDLGGYEGYIYSSYDTYLPSPYIAEHIEPVRSGLWLGVIMVLAACVSVGTIVWRFLNAGKKG